MKISTNEEFIAFLEKSGVKRDGNQTPFPDFSDEQIQELFDGDYGQFGMILMIWTDIWHRNPIPKDFIVRRFATRQDQEKAVGALQRMAEKGYLTIAEKEDDTLDINLLGFFGQVDEMNRRRNKMQ